MSNEHVMLSGKIVHVFAHRFVVQTAKGAILADLTPHGAERADLRIGAEVELEGEMKPSELKVFRFTCNGKSVAIEHKKKPDHGHHQPAAPAVAIKSIQEAGYEPISVPRRKPKHFEIEGRRNGLDYELHVELEGRIRKAKLMGGHG